MSKIWFVCACLNMSADPLQCRAAAHWTIRTLKSNKRIHYTFNLLTKHNNIGIVVLLILYLYYCYFLSVRTILQTFSRLADNIKIFVVKWTGLALLYQNMDLQSSWNLVWEWLFSHTGSFALKRNFPFGLFSPDWWDPLAV